jgi:pimeloyl-ACP methyl ester carboxylesterase
MAPMDDAAGGDVEVIEAGAGRPVLVLGAGFASSPAFAMLAKRFALFAMTAPDAASAAAWIASRGLARLGVVGIGEAAGVALAVAAAVGDAVEALVLVSPIGLPLGDADSPLKPLLKATTAAKCVMVGDRDPEARHLAAYRTELSKSHVVLVFDSGPDIAGERPQAFANVAGDFLDRQGRFSFVAGSVAVST